MCINIVVCYETYFLVQEENGVNYVQVLCIRPVGAEIYHFSLCSCVYQK